MTCLDPGDPVMSSRGAAGGVAVSSNLRARKRCLNASIHFCIKKNGSDDETSIDKG